MNDIVNNKKIHNIVNDNSFAISHTAHLLKISSKVNLRERKRNRSVKRLEDLVWLSVWI